MAREKKQAEILTSPQVYKSESIKYQIVWSWQHSVYYIYFHLVLLVNTEKRMNRIVFVFMH